jgi:hypothetical protein
MTAALHAMISTSKEILRYGGIPVPYTVSWSAEEAPGMLYLGTCPYARRTAIRQHHARGQGKPRFGAPHADRQREVIVLGLCDLCARPLKTNTKVSLSQARPQLHAARPLDVLQVEPLLHKECAAESMRHCPSLRRQIEDGSLNIRQVSRWACQLAIYSEQGTFEAVGVRTEAVSHAKVQLIKWIDRDLSWLCASRHDR